jgi:predicted tellurium resistance membrane protein TerC
MSVWSQYTSGFKNTFSSEKTVVAEAYKWWCLDQVCPLSIDNVIAVAAAAEQAHADHKMILVAFGIMVSIPIVIWGSSVILKVMHKFPAVVTLGAALLGYLGGAMISHDVALVDWTTQNLPMDLLRFHNVGVHLSLTGTAGAILVVALGAWLGKKESSEQDNASQEIPSKAD